VGNFSTNLGNVSFSRKTLIHRVCKPVRTAILNEPQWTCSICYKCGQWIAAYSHLYPSLNLRQYKAEVFCIVTRPSATPLTAALWATDLNKSFQGLFAYVQRLSNDLHCTCGNLKRCQIAIIYACCSSVFQSSGSFHGPTIAVNIRVSSFRLRIVFKGTAEIISRTSLCINGTSPVLMKKGDYFYFVIQPTAILWLEITPSMTVNTGFMASSSEYPLNITEISLNAL